MTSGRGDFSISPKDCGDTGFFVVVHSDGHSPIVPLPAVTAVTVKEEEESLPMLYLGIGGIIAVLSGGAGYYFMGRGAKEVLGEVDEEETDSWDEVDPDGMQMIDWCRCTPDQKEALAPTHEGFITEQVAITQNGKLSVPRLFANPFSIFSRCLLLGLP